MVFCIPKLPVWAWWRQFPLPHCSPMFLCQSSQKLSLGSNLHCPSPQQGLCPDFQMEGAAWRKFLRSLAGTGLGLALILKLDCCCCCCDTLWIRMRGWVAWLVAFSLWSHWLMAPSLEVPLCPLGLIPRQVCMWLQPKNSTDCFVISRCALLSPFPHFLCLWLIWYTNVLGIQMSSVWRAYCLILIGKLKWKRTWMTRSIMSDPGVSQETFCFIWRNPFIDFSFVMKTPMWHLLMYYPAWQWK